MKLFFWKYFEFEFPEHIFEFQKLIFFFVMYFFKILDYIYYSEFSNPRIRVIFSKDDRAEVKSDMLQEEIAFFFT